MRPTPARTAVRLLIAVGVVMTALLGSALPGWAAPPDPVFDPGADWTMTSSREDPSTAPAPECGTASEWTWTSADRTMTMRQVPCESSNAASGMFEWWGHDGELVGGASDEGELVLWTGQGVLRAWVDGDSTLTVLTIACPAADRDDCVSSTAALGTEAMTAGTGGLADVETPGLTIQSLVIVFVGPLMLIAIFVLPVRLVRALARPRYTSASSSPRYHDVTPVVSRARWRRRVRRTLWWLAAFMAFIAVAATSTGEWNQVYGGILFGVPLLALAIVGARTFLRPHPVERGRRGVRGLGGEAAVGISLSVISMGLLVLILIMYVFASAYGSMSGGWPSTSSADVRRMDLPLLPGLLPIVTALGTDTHILLSILLLPVLAGVAMLDGLGLRLRSASIDEALAQDDRPHYLYLRSFDEDTLTLAGQLRRRGLISSLSVMRAVRFEEVLVRQLSATGPVIAIAPPGANMPAIGAARASFSNDEWREHVIRYAETARAVVLSATPGEIRPGYGWELDLIAHGISHQRVMVVLGPWPLRQLRRRWTQFCHAVSPVPFFAPITMPWVPDGVHVLAHSSRQGWHGVGARRRLDWTYAVAIDEATRAYLPDWS